MDASVARRNLKLLQILKALRGALLVMPVIVPFFQSNGLSQSEIFLLQSAFAVAILVFEVPSGYFADRFSRKHSLLLGAILSIIGFSLYALAYGFWPLLAAEVVLGIAASFISGADSALAYDTMLSSKQEGKYRRFEAIGLTYAGLGEAVASIVGGLIAAASLRATIFAQVAVYLFLIPVTLMLREPERHKTQAKRNVMRDVLRVTKYALHGHQEIKWLIFYAAVVGTLTHTMVWLTQPYYQLAGVPIAWFGVLWAVQFGAIAIFALFADRFESLGRRKVLTAFLLIGVVSYVLLALAPSVWFLPALLGFYFIRAVFTPIIRDYVNRLIESDVRATVLSVKNLAQKVLYIGAGPLIGWVMDLYSLQTALYFSALFYGILGAITLFMMKRARIL